MSNLTYDTLRKCRNGRSLSVMFYGATGLACASLMVSGIYQTIRSTMIVAVFPDGIVSKVNPSYVLGLGILSNVLGFGGLGILCCRKSYQNFKLYNNYNKQINSLISKTVNKV